MFNYPLLPCFNSFPCYNPPGIPLVPPPGGAPPGGAPPGVPGVPVAPALPPQPMFLNNIVLPIPNSMPSIRYHTKDIMVKNKMTNYIIEKILKKI